MRVVRNADEMLDGALMDVFNTGIDVSPRDQETLEVQGWTVRLVKPRARVVMNPVRDIRLGYAAANVAWNLDRRNDVESIVWWNPNGRYITDDGETFHGANYGQRWHGYLQEALSLLDDDPDTRRAWVPIWRPQDIVADVALGEKDAHPNWFYARWGKDVPCTLGFGLRKFEARLDMSVVMRSQSVSILPYDLFLFSTLQELLAHSLGLQLGHLTWHAVSLHVYLKREYTTNRSAADWYSENRVAVSNHDFDWSRKMQREMPSLAITYDEAAKKWPKFMDAVRLGEKPEPSDPIEEMMWEGRPRG